MMGSIAPALFTRSRAESAMDSIGVMMMGSMASDNGKRRLRTALLANEDMDLKSGGNLLKAE
jgi:hypothetical protein